MHTFIIMSQHGGRGAAGKRSSRGRLDWPAHGGCGQLGRTAHRTPETVARMKQLPDTVPHCVGLGRNRNAHLLGLAGSRGAACGVFLWHSLLQSQDEGPAKIPRRQRGAKSLCEPPSTACSPAKQFRYSSHSKQHPLTCQSQCHSDNANPNVHSHVQHPKNTTLQTSIRM